MRTGTTARRKATNLSLEPRLVAEARRLGVNLSRAAEDGIRRAVAARWQAENAEAIRQSNEYVEKHGCRSPATACSDGSCVPAGGGALAVIRPALDMMFKGLDNGGR